MQKEKKTQSGALNGVKMAQKWRIDDGGWMVFS